MSARIEAATGADAGEIARLLGELGYEASPDEVAGRLALLDTVLVARDGGQVVALAAFEIVRLLHRPAPLGRLTTLVVDARARGEGVGRRLIAEVERLARARGCERLEVTSGGQRGGAHTFYTRLGYESGSKRFTKVLG